MNSLKSWMLATLGIVSLGAFLTLRIVRASSAEAPTGAASTAHFNSGHTYLLTPANGTGPIRCKVTAVDGAWLKCEGEKFEWVNTDTMMYASDSR
ncbi:MAG: hypothetical protein JO166_17815 [Deltaproteobacteria bacterium]|nr:hypothetical protein [Deltaproteobacteria bacterium]